MGESPEGGESTPGYKEKKKGQRKAPHWISSRRLQEKKK